STIVTSDPTILPISEAATEMMGVPSQAEYHSAILDRMTSELGFSGAIPDTLFLYDFSAESTRPPGQVNYLNQYEQPDLPVRFGNRSGNACGPSSLVMALSEVRVAVPVLDAYNNTMTAGVADPNWPGEQSREFAWQPGATYAQDKPGPPHAAL